MGLYLRIIQIVTDYFMLWSLGDVFENLWKIYEIIFVYFLSNRYEESNIWH